MLDKLRIRPCRDVGRGDTHAILGVGLYDDAVQNRLFFKGHIHMRIDEASALPVIMLDELNTRACPEIDCDLRVTLSQAFNLDWIFRGETRRHLNRPNLTRIFSREF